MDSSLKEIDNISDKKNNLTNSQKLRELISVRNEDDVNAVYNNDIVENLESLFASSKIDMKSDP